MTNAIIVTPEEMEKMKNDIRTSVMEEVKTMLSSMNSQEVFLSAKDVVEKYPISLNTLWRVAKTGLLVPSKMGRNRVYKQSDVEAFLSRK